MYEVVGQTSSATPLAHGRKYLHISQMVSQGSQCRRDDSERKRRAVAAQQAGFDGEHCHGDPQVSRD
jgi:hypothetical protein